MTNLNALKIVTNLYRFGYHALHSKRNSPVVHQSSPPRLEGERLVPRPLWRHPTSQSFPAINSAYVLKSCNPLDLTALQLVNGK